MLIMRKFLQEAHMISIISHGSFSSHKSAAMHGDLSFNTVIPRVKGGRQQRRLGGLALSISFAGNAARHVRFFVIYMPP